MLLQKLKDSCNESHLQIRAGEYATKIMNQSISLQEYKELLVANFYFHTTVEEQLFPRLASVTPLEYAVRIKSEVIEKDLVELELAKFISLEAEDKPICKVASFSEALGALYVTEGTAIGGAIIRKNLLKSETIKSVSSIHFFGCYGKSLSPLWKSLVAYYATAEVNTSTCIAKAKETFLFYEACLNYAKHKLSEKENSVYM